MAQDGGPVRQLVDRVYQSRDPHLLKFMRNLMRVLMLALTSTLRRMLTLMRTLKLRLALMRKHMRSFKLMFMIMPCRIHHPINDDMMSRHMQVNIQKFKIQS